MRRKSKVQKWWLRYEYKHTTLAVLAIMLFILALDSVVIVSIFGFLENLGYVGGFVAGLLSVSFFTAAPAVVLMIDLSTQLEPHWLALVIAIGSTVGDWLALKFYDEKVFSELRPLLKKFRISSLVRLLRYRFTSWALFLVGAFIIATPIPDEVGLSLMGVSKFRKRYILFICFLLNVLGALTVILIARSLRG